MGKPLMIREDDECRIVGLMNRLGLRHKVDVLRAGLDLLEKEANRRDRVLRWQHAAAIVAGTSQEVNTGFQKHSRLKEI
jgi:hypothetical protein